VLVTDGSCILYLLIEIRCTNPLTIKEGESFTVPTRLVHDSFLFTTLPGTVASVSTGGRYFIVTIRLGTGGSPTTTPISTPSIPTTSPTAPSNPLPTPSRIRGKPNACLKEAPVPHPDGAGWSCQNTPMKYVGW
jgi:hypothetical protein